MVQFHVATMEKSMCICQFCSADLNLTTHRFWCPILNPVCNQEQTNAENQSNESATNEDEETFDPDFAC